MLSNIRIDGNCFLEELNFDWTQVFNCNYRRPCGMGVKLGVLRYKRLNVFENRVLGRIFVNLGGGERKGGERERERR